jgi:hypothetical protein
VGLEVGLRVGQKVGLNVGLSCHMTTRDFTRTTPTYVGILTCMWVQLLSPNLEDNTIYLEYHMVLLSIVTMGDASTKKVGGPGPVAPDSARSRWKRRAHRPSCPPRPLSFKGSSGFRDAILCAGPVCPSHFSYSYITTRTLGLVITQTNHHSQSKSKLDHNHTRTNQYYHIQILRQQDLRV